MTDAGGPALDRLLELTVLLGADMSSHLGAQGLSESRAHLLFVLHSTGPATQRALADALEVVPRTITGLVDGLEASGHVTREAHPTDRRATLVTPTARGAQAARDLVEGRVELARALFAGWDPQRIAALVTGLDDVLDRVRTLIEEASS